MTMIGPAAPRQECPACEGSGIDHWHKVMNFHPGWPLPERGEWVECEIPVECDICQGSGRVTKKVIRWWNGEKVEAQS